MASYFDHNATTPVSPEVWAAYEPMLREDFGNASSIHTFGQTARRKVEAGRASVARFLGCDAKEIVFTSGGTEADNLALFGCVRPAEGKHVVTTAIEHPAVLNACAQLEREGCAVTYLAPPINAAAVRDALQPGTVLVSVMHANNETGEVLPVAGIAEVTRAAGVLLHCDGVQAAGRLSIDVRALGVDLYTISGHKMYAPKGVGALYVRSGVKVTPMLFGGRHERERRAGTENSAGIVALGAAAEWLIENGDAECVRLAALRDRLESGLLARVPDVVVNGASPRMPNTTNLRFAGLEGESLVIALDLAGFAVSTGAACSSGAVAPSHVLTAMGLTKGEAKASLRFSLGRANDEGQVDALIAAAEKAVARLRKLSPEYTHV